MRVIAGTHRSRQLKSVPGENTRPTLDKVKGAVFSSLGSYFDGGRVLDLFSGSGNIGIECLSRGMDEGVFVDKAYSAIAVIQENLKALKIDHQLVWKMEYQKALEKCKLNELKFNLIYLDPPYKEKIIEEIVESISNFQLLEDDGVIVCETIKEYLLEDKIGKFTKYKEAVYGIVKITFYRKEEEK